MPDVDKDVGERLACLDVDDADIHQEEDTWLPFSHVLSDWVSPCVVATGWEYSLAGCPERELKKYYSLRTLSDDRSKNAGVVLDLDFFDCVA